MEAYSYIQKGAVAAMVDLEIYLAELKDRGVDVTEAVEYLEGIISDQSSPPPHGVFAADDASVPPSEHGLCR